MPRYRTFRGADNFIDVVLLAKATAVAVLDFAPLTHNALCSPPRHIPQSIQIALGTQDCPPQFDKVAASDDGISAAYHIAHHIKTRRALMAASLAALVLLALGIKGRKVDNIPRTLDCQPQRLLCPSGGVLHHFCKVGYAPIHSDVVGIAADGKDHLERLPTPHLAMGEDVPQHITHNIIEQPARQIPAN